MKKLLLTTLLVVTFFALTAVSASAVVNDTVKVGLRYGSSVLAAANLENTVGGGYEFGYFDEDLLGVGLDRGDRHYYVSYGGRRHPGNNYRNG